jgi:hypothetical protein
MYTYYIAFIAKNKSGQLGPGSAVIQREKPIETLKDLDGITKDIKKSKKYASITILNWETLNGLK